MQYGTGNPKHTIRNTKVKLATYQFDIDYSKLKTSIQNIIIHKHFTDLTRQ